MDKNGKAVFQIQISNFDLSPYQILVLGFAGLIVFGTILLTLPLSSASGHSTPIIDALFTATSAVCVTGLIVLDTGVYWSPFGQMVIITLIQAGGLGIMTMTTLMALLVGKKIKLRERLIIQEALNQLTLSGVVRLTIYVVKVTLLIEFIGGTILALHWYGDFGPKAIYFGYWHAISSFCNAGFDLLGDFRSLTGYVSDWTVNLVVSGLIILGGIGFTVIADVWTNRRFDTLSLHSRIVLVTSLLLIAIGTLVIFIIEQDNPETLAALDWDGQLLASYFQSVSTRTAGYNTLDMSKLESATLFFMVILMFIGASPASTGGGIKTSTFAVLIISIWALIRGKEDAEAFERRIPYRVVYKAFSVLFISALLVVIITMMLCVNEPHPFINILFEVVSAFGTVGLSTGITPSLTTSSKLWLIFTMFAGRVGPITLALAFALKEKKRPFQYPEGKILIG